MNEGETYVALSAAICITLVVLLTGAAMVSCQQHAERARDFKADKCQLVSESKTGKKTYCGKACWRDEIRKEYQCTSGTRVTIE